MRRNKKSIALLLVILTVLLSVFNSLIFIGSASAAGALSNELLTNGSFEQAIGTGNWEWAEGLAVSAEKANSG